MLGKHLPRDTYTVYKRGGCLRVDGHLKGMNEDAKTLLPSWKYGHFSVMIDTSPGGKAEPVYVSHDKQRFTPLDVRPGCRLLCMTGLSACWTQTQLGVTHEA